MSHHHQLTSQKQMPEPEPMVDAGEVHRPAIGECWQATPPMRNVDSHQGCTYISQHWNNQNGRTPQGMLEMQQIVSIVRDWQVYNDINQPGGAKQEDHVLKYRI